MNKSILTSTLNTRWCIPGQYMRSDMIGSITDKEIDMLLKEGIKTIIDLRSTTEVFTKNSAMIDIEDRTNGQIKYLEMPLYEFAFPSHRDEDLFYKTYYERCVDQKLLGYIRYIMSLRGGVLYYCYAGKDRTGIISAILMKEYGYPEDEIIKNYLLTNDYLSVREEPFSPAKIKYIKKALKSYDLIKQIESPIPEYEMHTIIQYLSEISIRYDIEPEDMIEKVGKEILKMFVSSRELIPYESFVNEYIYRSKSRFQTIARVCPLPKGKELVYKISTKERKDDKIEKILREILQNN